MWKNYKLYTLISVLFVTVILTSNITSTKIVEIFWFTFDGGTLLFPLSYIFWDILTEVYGYKNARKILWMWLLWALIMSLTIMWVWLLPASPSWAFEKDYQNILWLTPRLVFASIIAYFAWEFSNSYIVAKIKLMMKGKMMAFRLIASTIVWQFIDTAIFIFVAFWWIWFFSLLSFTYQPVLQPVFPLDVLIQICVSNYILKVGIEVLFAPLTIMIIQKIKRIEEEDYYDMKTNFNPFKIN